MADKGQQSIAFVNFEFKDNYNQTLPVAGDENKTPISMGLYLCVCENQNTESDAGVCLIKETALKEEIKDCDKLYGILEDPSNAKANISTLSWGEFLEDHCKTKFDPSFDYIITFNTGQRVRFDEKVTSFFKKRKGRRQKRIFSLTDITRYPKQTYIDTASTYTVAENGDPEKALDLTTRITPQKECEPLLKNTCDYSCIVDVAKHLHLQHE